MSAGCGLLQRVTSPYQPADPNASHDKNSGDLREQQQLPSRTNRPLALRIRPVDREPRFGGALEVAVRGELRARRAIRLASCRAAVRSRVRSATQSEKRIRPARKPVPAARKGRDPSPPGLRSEHNRRHRCQKRSTAQRRRAGARHPRRGRAVGGSCCGAGHVASRCSDGARMSAKTRGSACC
jgi:hypothetical protein